ncbi:hypothetical protein ABT297_24805 [Dactylosporangium sp. NPDC000555]|uniref:hypothetical protein n=1 Tax=Dactylosporangium sp. NPDC000555 TaxID=3154260 RepID=UPI00331AF7E1
MASLGLALALTVLSGCTSTGSGQSGTAGGGAGATESARTYGYGPANDKSIKYQPDVVIVEGGPNAVRSATGDGLTWTIDGKARGASDIKPGKVMYATSRAVGRVVDLQRAGDDIAVTLAPVKLTEVFRDARFTIDRAIDESALVYQEIPDLPAAVTIPAQPRNKMEPIAYTGGASSDQTETVLALHPIRLGPGSKRPMPLAREANYTAAVGDWEAQPYRSSGNLGLKVGYAANENLKVFVDFSMKVDKLRIRSDVSISNGTIGSRSTFALDGIKSIAVNIAAGAANGADDNKKVRVEVPVEINIPIPGEPLMYSNTWKFIVTTALGGKNATLTAGGEWALDGLIGMVDGSLVTPVLSVTKSIMDSITGLSVGVSGIVFAVECKIQFGIGIPAAFAGPYAKLVVDLGVTNGSALGAPLARCIGAALDAKVGGGFGFNLSSDKLKALEALLPKTVKFELERETLAPFFQKKQTLPDVPLCTGPA